MQSIIQRALAVSSLLAVAACGGGGSSAGAVSALPVGGNKTPQSASVTFNVKIPPKVSSQARSGKWITANVQGVAINVAQSPATNYSGYNFYPISPTVPYCTTVTGGGLNCALALMAPPGNDVFTVTTYDTPNFNGYPISTGNVTSQIAGGVNNSVNITTSGIVQTILASVDDPNPPMSLVITQQIRIAALDGDNNLIVGNFDFPISVSDSDTTGNITVSSKSLATSSDLANLTATSNGTSSVAATITVAPTSPNSYNGGTSFTIADGKVGLTVNPSLLIFASPTAAAQNVQVGYIGTGPTMPFSYGGSGQLTVTPGSTVPVPTFAVAPVSSGTFPLVTTQLFYDHSRVYTASANVVIQ